LLLSYLCPVCNGLDQLQASCRSCGGAAEDCGKASDYYGPYSPYRPIDELKLTNGFPDLAQHQCYHALYCPSCDSTQLHAVDEIRS
jgi:hypothetical protein